MALPARLVPNVYGSGDHDPAFWQGSDCMVAVMKEDRELKLQAAVETLMAVIVVIILPMAYQLVLWYATQVFHAH